MYVFQLVLLLPCVSSPFPFSKGGKGENTNIHVYKSSNKYTIDPTISVIMGLGKKYA
jgi:hypothetical protein